MVFLVELFLWLEKRDDTRGTLFYDALRYLKEHRPRYFIAENVKGLLSHDLGKTFQTIIDCLAKTVNYALLDFDLSHFIKIYKSIPQKRVREYLLLHKR